MSEHQQIIEAGDSLTIKIGRQRAMAMIVPKYDVFSENWDVIVFHDGPFGLTEQTRESVTGRDAAVERGRVMIREVADRVLEQANHIGREYMRHVSASLDADSSIYPTSGDAIHLPDLDMETISPGVRDLVDALRRAGLHTTDSGDGSSYADGMECALPFHHVFVAGPPGTKEKLVKAVKRVLASNPTVIDWPAEVSAFDDVANGDHGVTAVDAVAVWHADREEICKRVGYEWGPE